MTLLPPYTNRRKLPVNYKKEDFKLFEQEKERFFPESSLKVFNNATINFKGVLFENNKILYSESFQRVNPSKLFNLVLTTYHLLLKWFSKGQTIEQALVCSNDWSKEYFHWFSDVLPKILAFSNAYEKEPLPTLIIPHHLSQSSFITQSLNLLKVPYKIVNKWEKVKITQLFYPTAVAPTGNYSPAITLQLNQKLVQANYQLSKKYSSRIYISRAKAPQRKVLNEDKLTPILKKYNFEILHFEDLAWTEQISICNNASILISIHGAGLTNMLFMPKGSTILELRKKGDAGNNCYFSLASALNFNYFYQQCETTAFKTQKADFTVDPIELEANIQQILAYTKMQENGSYIAAKLKWE